MKGSSGGRKGRCQRFRVRILVQARWVVLGGFDGLGLKRSELKVSALVAGVREPWGCFEWLRGKGGG